MALRFTQRDFLGLREEMIRFMSEKLGSKWNDYSESDETMTLIELLAHCVSNLHFAYDNQKRETDIVTASFPRNVYAHAIRNGYKPSLFRAGKTWLNIDLRKNAGVDLRTRHRVSREMATRVRLAHRLDHRPTQLSGGECQRVAVARSLVNNPTFILADEPTGNLDEKTGNEIMALFHELHQAGTTIVMVTHNPQYESEYDRVIYLRNGRKWRVIDNVRHTTEEFET